ncbi:MAG TPA: OmpA family protein [Pyrinomonadaceae bacterium]|nr:OmpA family protein [Pyrinomonadaceae bacterium]
MYKSISSLIAAIVVFIAAAAAMAQVDVARRTTAITYPLDEVVMVQFRGTTRFPRMKGEAKIRRTSRNGTQIELSVSKMPRPFELGAGYATYVLWAVSPNGQVDNLGEIKRRGFFEFDSKITVTTPLQTFALIITAEPHFMVTRPSQAIMMENLGPVAVSGKTIATVPAIQYFGNSSDYFRDARTPEIAEVDYAKTPSTILQAKQAVALARYAGADQDDPDELQQAESLLANAEESWKAGRSEESVDITARQAISTAVKAESTAAIRKQARQQRNEKSRSDAEIRAAEDKYQDTLNQISELKNELAAETRRRELAERDATNYSGQVKDLRDENGRLRDELARTKLDAETAKNQLTTLQGENQSIKAERDKQDRIARIQAGEAALMASLKRVGTVTKNERGIIVTLPESFWSGVRTSTFAPNADEKMTALADIINNNPDYTVTIEAHTDNAGAPDQIQALTNGRAQAISARISALGVASTRIQASGMGASLPVAPNTTAANRAKNRRVQIILTPSVS